MAVNVYINHKRIPHGTIFFWALDGEIFKVIKQHRGGFAGNVPSQWRGMAIHFPDSEDLFVDRGDAIKHARKQIAASRKLLVEKASRLVG